MRHPIFTTHVHALDREWFYAIGKERQGPVYNEGLLKAFESGKLTPKDKIWCESFGDKWQKLKNTPEVLEWLQVCTNIVGHAIWTHALMKGATELHD